MLYRVQPSWDNGPRWPAERRDDGAPMDPTLRAVLTAEPNRVLSRAELLEQVWGYSSEVESRTVDNFIVRLRRYFEEEPEEPRHFISIRGRGYMYVP